jgi:hypothetical protein
MSRTDNPGPRPTPPPAGRCPVCDRYVGPASACPYCGEDVPAAAPIRFLRWGSLLLALIGVLCLWMAARSRAVPAVSASQVTPRMNHATVRAAGQVRRDAYVARRGGVVDYVSFGLDDGSGELRAAAYGATARALSDRGLVPRKGWSVEVVGSLQVDADSGAKVRLPGPEALRVLSGGPEPLRSDQSR